MPRYRVTIEYDGTPFVGWQRQDNGRSVQYAIEEAVFKLANERTIVFGAGRTDAGVHARGQVAHFDLVREWDPFRVSEAVNFHLKPEPVAILDCAQVPDDFHARFSATGRRYVYRIVNRRAPLALERDRAWEFIHPLDAEKMEEAAQILVGRHDFTSFRASLCQAKSPIKTLSAIAVRRAGDDVAVAVAAPSFLHHQVHNIVGTLVSVSTGKWTRDDLAHALAARDRTAAGQTAPAHGLYLIDVDYGPRAAADAMGGENDDQDE